MISPQFHPGDVRAQCEPRGKLSFALTPRTIALLLAGFVFLIFGLWDVRLSYAMLAWDALVLLAALLDGLRLPKPRESYRHSKVVERSRRSTARPKSN